MPPACVFSDTDRLSEYLEKPELSLVHVKNSQLDEAVHWLFHDADFTFHDVLDLSRQTGVFKISSTILQGRNLKTLTNLKLSQCNLNELPSTEHLIYLENLFLAGNNLKDISMLQHSELKYLDVTENPIETVDISFDSCPKIEEIKLGSNKTTCISTNILKRIQSDDLKIQVDDRYKASLMLPPLHIVNQGLSQSNVSQYLDDCLFDFSWYILKEGETSEDFVRRMSAVLPLEKRKIKKLEFSRQTESLLGSSSDNLLKFGCLCDVERLDFSSCNLTHMPSFHHLTNLTNIDFSGNNLGNDFDRLQGVINQNKTPYITKFNFSGNNLQKIPDLTTLTHLDTLNVRNNDITSLTSLENNNIKILKVEGNPLATLDFDPGKVPSIKKVMFGSLQTRYVNFSILQKVAMGIIELSLASEYEKSLFIPHPDLLKSQKELANYIKCTEISLHWFNTTNPDERLDCILWFFKNSPVEFESLNLSGQSEFCTSIQLEKLNGLINMMPTLTKLSLSDCELDTIPNVKVLTNLQVLDLKNNNIKKLDTVSNSVMEIDLQGNPIVGWTTRKSPYLP